MKTRIPGFSMMEIIVALAIGAIVLGISFTGFQIVSKAGLKISKLRKSQLMAENALSIIYYDFYAAEQIISVGNKYAFQDQDRLVFYSSFGDALIRTQLNNSDTFNNIGLSLQNKDLIINILDQEPIQLQRPLSAYSKLTAIEN